MPIEKKRVSDDKFAMWRAVFAFALVDGKLTLEEQNILTHHIETVPFSREQVKILRDDMRAPHDVEALYSEISANAHQEEFCALARTLVWCDGDIDLQEKEILQRVGCFQKRDALEMLKNSSGHEIYTKFTEMYETSSKLKGASPSPLFAVAA
jgi:hypothetical protein